MQGSRISREKKSIEKMIYIYCEAKHHAKGSLCDECQGLLEYALQRLNHCKFAEHKPVCSKCPIHCYRKDMREKVIDVMRYSGPRMMYKHPVLAIFHLIDTFRKQEGRT